MEFDGYINSGLLVLLLIKLAVLGPVEFVFKQPMSHVAFWSQMCY